MRIWYQAHQARLQADERAHGPHLASFHQVSCLLMSVTAAHERQHIFDFGWFVHSCTVCCIHIILCSLACAFAWPNVPWGKCVHLLYLRHRWPFSCSGHLGVGVGDSVSLLLLGVGYNIYITVEYTLNTGNTFPFFAFDTFNVHLSELLNRTYWYDPHKIRRSYRRSVVCRATLCEPQVVLVVRSVSPYPSSPTFCSKVERAAAADAARHDYRPRRWSGWSAPMLWRSLWPLSSSLQHHKLLRQCGGSYTLT